MKPSVKLWRFLCGSERMSRDPDEEYKDTRIAVFGFGRMRHVQEDGYRIKDFENFERSEIRGTFSFF